MIEGMSDNELENTTSACLDNIQELLQMYELLFAEGVNRRLPAFVSSDVMLLSQDDRMPVASYVKKLSNTDLVDCIYRYKEMPTCLRITVEEIKARLASTR